MSIPRFAGWGALGGVLLSGVVGLAAGPAAELVVIAPVFAVAGAISAAGTLVLARRGEDRVLPGAGAHEQRKLRENREP
jgi:hypothetical protein